MNTRGKSSVSHGWDTYWQGTPDADSYASDGTRHPAVMAFWNENLGRQLADADEKFQVLDIASGSGAVVESLLDNAGDHAPHITCVDISAAAIDSIQERYPGITTVVADARSIPLDAAYDLVTSQFGMEYAGPEALDEAARLLAPGGTMIMLMHRRPGVIFNECRVSLDALRRMRKARFFELALAFFEAGFAAVRGADRAPYDRAGRDLNPALRKIDAILDEHGEGVAGGVIAKLYADVERIHSRIQQHDPEEVIGWLQSMGGELDAYEARMASMCESALDKKAFGALCRRLENQGIAVVQRKPLKPAGSALPVAWIVRAERKPV